MGGQTINQTGQAFGVHPVQAGQWQKEIQAQTKKLFEGYRGSQPVAAHSEPDRRYGEIGRLKMKLDCSKNSRS